MPEESTVTLFLCGDVMTGRGIDQILAHPSDPVIHESFLQKATDYIEIAEARNGSIPRKVSADYIWGEALVELRRLDPDARIVNLETTITTSEDWCDKGINYRMSPENAQCLRVAGIDVCTLANNHILDWGKQGLMDTVNTLQKLAIRSIGAGSDAQEAQRPAILEHSKGGRIIVLAFGSVSSGIPQDWAASGRTPGVNLVEDCSDYCLAKTRDEISRLKRAGDIVVFSIHWGGNWSYDIPEKHRCFARRLIDEAQVDIIHGHSSHHVKGIEVYHGKLILYGCGDFITDYEGISGYEAFRGDLALMYFPHLSTKTGELQGCDIVPLKMLRFQLQRVTSKELEWLEQTLCREGKKGGTTVAKSGDRLTLHWGRSP